MDRAQLLASTCLPSAVGLHVEPGFRASGLLDAKGDPIPSAQPAIDIASLPLIAADALPPLPEGMEARLLLPANGAEPEIVLWIPAHAVSVCVPLIDRATVTEAAAMLSRAVAVATA